MILLILAALVALSDAGCSCPKIKAPKNGDYNLISQQCGATVTFSCDNGYRLDGCYTSLCTYVCPHGYQWSCPPPKCIGVCDELENPENGYVNVDNGVDIGDVASYCCASNYKLDGPQTRTCRSDRTWSGKAPKCRGVCQAPSAPAYGHVTTPNGLWVDSQAHYSCREHFVLVGDDVRTCESDFNWSGSTPRCIQVCDKPANPANGFVIAAEPIKVSNTVKYACNPGYALVGSEIRSCLAENRWNVPAPVCYKECKTPTAPAYGNVVYKTPCIYSVVAHFSCSVGYLLKGYSSSTCQADGSWSNPFPICVRVCSLPSPPANGGINPSTSQGIPVDGTVTYYCNYGYTLVGTTTRKCVGGTIWTLDAPECLKTCSKPDAPMNGDVDTSGGLYEGAVAKYSCDEHFRLNGKSTTTCLGNSTWSGETPECIGVCDPPEAPESGSVDISQGLDIGSVATFMCNYGYEMDGDETTECLPQNEWSNETPECVEVCFYPSVPSYGSVDTSQGLRVGAVAKYSCDENYRLDGDSETTCERGKTWSNPAPTCIEECDMPMADPNGGVTIPDGRDVGDVAFYYCNPGYVFSGCNCNKTVCMAGGVWSRAAPRCIEVCSEPVAPNNGKVTTNGVKVGDIAMYFCNDGYGLDGSMTSKCMPGGEWSDDTPTCVEVCEPPPDPGYGTVTVTGLMVGDIATYSCDANYILKGDETRTCERGGKWSGDEPTCVGIVKSCLPPPAPINGVVTTPNGVKVGMKAKYSCNDGYDLVGTRYRCCLKSLTWSDEVPLCVEVCTRPGNIPNGWVDTSQGVQVDDIARYRCRRGYILIGVSKRTCLTGDRWSDDEPKCVEVCDELMDPAYGDVSYSNGLQVHSVATYTCSRYYRLDGNEKRTCKPGGQWSGSRPRCVPVCSIPKAPENGAVDYSAGLDKGDVAIYSCDDGFILKGQRKTRCMCGNKWSYPPPTCVQVCELPDNPENGRIIASTKYLEVGSIIAYECKRGYILKGFVTRTCLEGPMWSGQAPICVPEAPKYCEAPGVPHYGACDVTDQADIGDVANYRCYEGYVLVGAKTIVCLPTGKWSHKPPTCLYEGGSGSSSSSFSSSMDDDTSSLGSPGPRSSSDNDTSSSKSGGGQGPLGRCCVHGKIKMSFYGAGSVQGQLPGVEASVRPCRARRVCGAMGFVKATFDRLIQCDKCLSAPDCGRRMLVVKLKLGLVRNGWLFNVGDSQYNMGSGSDDIDYQQNDAELRGLNGNITVFSSEKCPYQKILKHFNHGCGAQVNSVTLYISNLHVRIVTDQGLDTTICHRCLFALNGQPDSDQGGRNQQIFIGMNRVVRDISRSGYGVCSASLHWACPWCCY